MPRAIARGRIVPQSLSTDPRVGRLSLKAALLFPLMWINCDDQGRISGDPSEVKYIACPNIDHIAKEDIPELLDELQTQGLIKIYSTSKVNAIQMLDWWGEQKLQWAYPSRYPPPPGWTDHLRYHPTPKEIITENWPPESRLGSKLPSELPNSLPSTLQKSPLTTPSEKGKGNRRGRGKRKRNLPSALGSTSPSLTVNISQILEELTRCFKHDWGKVSGPDFEKVTPREPTARESAQLRDLAKNLSAGGGVPLDYIKQAFREAAHQEKYHISYVRAILLDWLDRPRGPP